MFKSLKMQLMVSGVACLALLNAGDEVLMADPGYPCNRQFVRMTGAQPVPLPATAATRFQPSAAQIAAAMTPRTRAAHAGAACLTCREPS